MAVLGPGYRPGMVQGRVTVARAIELLRRQPQDAEMRVVEVLTDEDGKAVGYVDGPATGIESTRSGPKQPVRFSS